MRRLLYGTLIVSFVCASGCEDEVDKKVDKKQVEQKSASTDEASDESPQNAPELVEQTERAEPRSVEGSDCDSPAKLTKLADNTVLTAKGGGCYLIDKTMEVRGETNKLTINPGVTIKFAENAGLYIHKGALEARGTKDKPIVLTGQREDPGFWKGLAIRGSNHRDNVFEHVDIRYAGNTETFSNVKPAALMFDSSRGKTTFDVKQTKLTNSAGYGLYAENELTGEFADNDMTGNKEGAAYLHPRSVTLLDANSNFAGNATDRIRVWGGKLTSQEHTWPAAGVPYVMAETVEVRSDGFLNLQPGVELQFAENTGLYIHKAKLKAAGTADAPITLTGKRQVNGFWRGVAIRGSDSVDNVWRHVTLEYAGSDNTFSNVDPAGLMLDSSRGANSIDIRESTFSNNGGYGLYSENQVDMKFANNRLTGNAKGAARVHPSVVGMLDAESGYSGNDQDRVSIWGSTLNGVEATWPAIDVPFYVESSIELRDDAFVTIQPGTTLQFAENAGLYVHKSKLKAAGTADKPITFAGAREAAGFWRGIAMRGTSSIDNQFKHVTITHAGSSDNFSNVTPAALMLDQSRGAVKVTIDELSVAESGGAGLHIESDATIESSDCAKIAADAKPRVTEGSKAMTDACKTSG
jgi:hypothetical protein